MAPVILNQRVQDEITRLSRVNNVNVKLLEEFAYFVIQKNRQEVKQVAKPLKIVELKQAIYNRFSVNNTQELRKSGSFKMATDGMGSFDFSLKSTWEMLYRKFIGILPDEENQQEYGCINGINIFKYFKPWQIFGLDPKTATKDDIKSAYYRLSKIYHPDNLITGDREIFERVEAIYKSIIIGIE